MDRASDQPLRAVPAGRARVAAGLGLAALAAGQLYSLRAACRPGLPLGWDTLGHYAKLDFLVRELLPRGQLDGWFPYWHGGFQLFLFYPPGFYWLAAALAAPLGTPLAFKVVLLGSLLALPPGLYRLLREAGLGRAAALAGALFGVFAGSSYGGGVVGTFAVGLVPNALGLALLSFALAAQLRALRTGATADLARAALLLGALVATHTFSAYLALLCLSALGLLAASSARSVRPLTRQALPVAGGALALSCFWWLPALLEWSLRGPIGAWQQPDRLEMLRAHWRGELIADPLVTWLGVAGLALALARGGAARRWLALLTLLTFALALNLCNQWLPFSATVASSQFMRFHGPLSLLWAAQAGSCVGDVWQVLRRRPGRLRQVAWLVPVLVAGAIAHWSWPRYQSQVGAFVKVESDRPALEQAAAVADWLRANLDPSERLLSEFEWGRAELFGTPHVLNQFAALRARRMDLNGSFAEGVATTRETLGLGQDLRVPGESFEAPLERFAVGWAVTYTPEGARSLDLRPGWVRVHTVEPLAVFRYLRARPFLRGADGLEAGRLVPARDGWTGPLTPAGPGWLDLAVNYSPGWQALVDGRSAPTARSAAGLLQVYVPLPGARHLELRFGRLWQERAAGALSLAALLALSFLARPRRSP